MFILNAISDINDTEFPVLGAVLYNLDGSPLSFHWKMYREEQLLPFCTFCEPHRDSRIFCHGNHSILYHCQDNSPGHVEYSTACLTYNDCSTWTRCHLHL